MNEPESPPLSIRHFFYLTFGIAVAVWLHTRGMRVKPTTLAAGVALAARVVSAFIQGGAIAAFLWLTARWLTRRPVKLQDPGSIYVFVLSINLFLALVGGIIVFLILIVGNRPNGWSQWVALPSMIAGALIVTLPPIYGAMRAREWSWKIIFVCEFLKYVLAIFHISLLFIRLGRPWSLNGVAFTSQCIIVTLQAVIMIAATTSVVIDWRHKTPRHWLHYFGIGLLALSSIQFFLQRSPQLAKLMFFPYNDNSDSVFPRLLATSHQFPRLISAPSPRYVNGVSIPVTRQNRKDATQMRSLLLATILALAALAPALADDPSPIKNPLRISAVIEGEGLETSVEIKVKNAGTSKILIDKHLVLGFYFYFDDEFGEATYWQSLAARPTFEQKFAPDKGLVEEVVLKIAKERFTYLEPGASLTRKVHPYQAFAVTKSTPGGSKDGQLIFKQRILVDRLLPTDARLTKCHVRYGMPYEIPLEPLPEGVNAKDFPNQKVEIVAERFLPRRPIGQTATPVNDDSEDDSEKKRATPSQAEVIKKFHDRASKEDIAEWQGLSQDNDSKKQSHMLELLLGKLDDDELFSLGITAIDQPGRKEWGIAWSDNSAESMEAIESALNKVGLEAGGSFGRGRAGWYVDKVDFFKAQAALNASPEVRACGVTIVKPKLSLR